MGLPNIQLFEDLVAIRQIHLKSFRDQGAVAQTYQVVCVLVIVIVS